MRSRLLRALLTLTAFVAAWFVVSPAQAGELATRVVANASFVPASLAPPAPLPEAEPPSQRAPLCDPRGAITFAPPPQMQEVEASLDTGLTLDDCFDGSDGARNGARSSSPSYRGGRAPLPIDASSASTDAAVLSTAVVLPPVWRELTPAPAASTPCSRPGIRSTVDRPPRA